MTRIVLFLALLFAAPAAFSQVVTVRGFLKDSITHFPIKNGTITNSRDGKPVAVNSQGFFSLRLSPGDRIMITAPEYRFDTLTYTFLSPDTMNIYLAPLQNMLDVVTVRSKYTQYQLDSIDRKTTFDKARGQRMTTVSRPNSGGFGVGINLDRLSKKKYRNQEQEDELFRKNEEASYVQYRFSPQLVSQYTGLKDRDLRLFMYRYTPSYQWLRAHPSHEELVYYISEKYRAYKKGER